VPFERRTQNLFMAEVLIEAFLEQKTNFVVKRNTVSLVTSLVFHFSVYIP